MSESMCIINAKNGMGTSSPQVTQFSHNCDCIKFIVDKDFTNYAVVVIASIEGEVMVVSEGDALKKSYDTSAKESTIMWYPTSEITALSGCVVYQVAAYDAETKDTIWYSKEGRLIVNDSIDTTDCSTQLIGSSPNLVMQILTTAKEAQLKALSLMETKVDKEDGMMLSSNDFTDEEKAAIKENGDNIALLSNLIDTLNTKLNDTNSQINESNNNISLNSNRIYELEAEANSQLSKITDLQIVAEENKGETIYNAKSEKAQSGIAVAQAIAAIVDSAPETLNTLEELAKALGNDPNFATTIMTLLGKKVDDSLFEHQVSLFNENLDEKVDKEDGKGLSSNDFTDDEKSDLAEVVEHAISLEENKADAFALEAHTSNTENPHSVTKSQIGLGNADNTSDMDKPISRAMQEAFDSINEAIEQISGIVADKSDKADKLSGYGITDAYTKDEVITLINNAIGEALEADY